MKTVTLGLILLCLSCLGTSTAGAQDPNSQQQSKPGLDLQQRIELAKTLLEPIRQKATTDLGSPERQHYFTGHWAKIDPAWTAKFITDNPVPQISTTEDRILYDHIAVRTLMTRATEIKPADLIRLLESQGQTFTSTQYAILALEAIPEDQVDLRRKIIEVAAADLGEPPMIPSSFGSQLKLAKLSQDSKLLAKVEQAIENFYESGKAKESWDSLRKRPEMSGNNLNYYRTMYRQYAPEKFRHEYGGSDAANSANDIYQLIRSESLNAEEKIAELKQITKIDFGKQPYEQMMAASSLGMVATLDHELAIQFAQSAPTQSSKIWAKLMVTPSLAKHDLTAAKKLIKTCYEEIPQLDSSDRNAYSYNHSPATIGARGLRIVAAVAPERLDECIEKTIEAANLLKNSRMSTAHDHRFFAVAAIAPYNREKAELLFDEIADDVPIGAAAAFFRALMALHPEQVLDEYQEMPEKDARGTDYRIYVRNEILPALLTNSDQAYWDQLNNSGLGAFDLNILER